MLQLECSMTNITGQANTLILTSTTAISKTLNSLTNAQLALLQTGTTLVELDSLKKVMVQVIARKITTMMQDKSISFLIEKAKFRPP